jgi:cell division initiation protein
MKLTPLDILHHEFVGAFTGYNRSEVKTFLKEVSDQLEQTLRDNSALHSRIDELGLQIENLKQHEEELRRVVISAERIASELKNNAEKEAVLILQDAENRRDSLLHEAASRKDHLIREAESRHDQLVKSAEEQHDALLKDARATMQHTQTELEKIRSERAQFLAQYKGLLQGFLNLAERYED